ncbi:MAG: amidohydrolase family protein [Candidatus Eremiobacteraeota bacterium]|nr:amidohydrolase family protein [Candidatus Eremiobacteraeota bacterium]
MGGRTIGHALLAIGDGTSHQGSIRIEDGRIARLDDGPHHLDYELPFGSTVTPGLIDLHVNGAAGQWFNRMPVEAMRVLESSGPRAGLTAYLPTIITGPWDEMLRAAREIYRKMEMPSSGARALGVHFEGPFINPEYRRFHQAEFLLAPTPGRVEALLSTWTCGRCRVTMAPEIDDGRAAAAELRRRGVVLSAGHTAGTFSVGVQAIEDGFRILTHSFNAMPGLHHRSSSILVAYLLDPAAFCEVIADGTHVSPEHVALLYRLKALNLVLSTDAMPVTEGLVEEGGVIRDLDGVIAGSRLLPDEAVRNLMNATGVTLAEAVACATWAPARAIGLDAELGMLREGLRADLAVWDRHNRISHVFIGGELVYSND